MRLGSGFCLPVQRCTQQSSRAFCRPDSRDQTDPDTNKDQRNGWPGRKNSTPFGECLLVGARARGLGILVQRWVDDGGQPGPMDVVHVRRAPTAAVLVLGPAAGYSYAGGPAGAVFSSEG